MAFTRAGRTATIAAASALLLASAPVALAATSEISGKITPNQGRPGTPLNLDITFGITPEDRDVPATLRNVVLQFPPNATVNGRFFRNCAPAILNRAKRPSACPRGSAIGRGSLRADVPNAGVYNVPGKVFLFNDAAGKKITVYIEANNPVDIRQAFTATLKRTGGRFGYTLNAPVPTSLQDIQPGQDWYVGVRTFTTQVTGRARDSRGRTRGFIEAKRCPSGGRVPIAGTFTFVRDHATSSASGTITCKP